jgi:hypothetical protein
MISSIPDFSQFNIFLILWVIMAPKLNVFSSTSKKRKLYRERWEQLSANPPPTWQDKTPRLVILHHNRHLENKMQSMLNYLNRLKHLLEQPRLPWPPSLKAPSLNLTFNLAVNVSPWMVSLCQMDGIDATDRCGWQCSQRS